MDYLDTLTVAAYTAYAAALDGRDDRGVPLPPYEDLHVSQRLAWRQAILSALAVYTPPSLPPATVEPSPVAVVEEPPAASPPARPARRGTLRRRQ